MKPTPEAHPLHPPAAADPAAPPEAPRYTRHSDADLDPEGFDLETGEYITAQVQTQSGKVDANAWAEAKLAALTAAKSMRSTTHSRPVRSTR